MCVAYDTMSSPVPTSAPAAAPAAAGSDILASKVQKHVDGLHAKIAKLQSDNAALKAQLAATKASGSRIRRIPKKAAAPEAAAQ